MIIHSKPFISLRTTFYLHRFTLIKVMFLKSTALIMTQALISIRFFFFFHFFFCCVYNLDVFASEQMLNNTKFTLNQMIESYEK